MLKHPSLTEARIRSALKRIELSIYSPGLPVDVAVWRVGGEPVSPRVAFKARYRPIAVGESWGALWDTEWFRFRGTVPKSWKGQEVVVRIRLTNCGREGFSAEGLVYQNGAVIRAINANRSDVEISRRAAGGERFEFYVEAAANGGANDAGQTTGVILPDYEGERLFHLEQAELACMNRKVFDFYYDFKVALEAMEVFPVESQRRGELRYALNSAINLFSSDDPTTIAQARLALKEVMLRQNGGTVHYLSAVGHAHIDTAWLWPVREAIRKCARTFSTALDYMEKYPEYIFACSQAQQYAWMKAHYPEIWRRIKAAVKRGQWEPIGSMWVETDCNLVSGESLVRQILHGKRFFREELGYETKDVWIPDVFGYAASMPQIMRQAGVDYFLTSKISWNQFNKFPHHTFLWEGIDGTQIFTHFPPTDDCNADPGPRHLMRNIANFKEHGRAERSLLLYGWGDGGGGPSIEMLEKAKRLKDFDGLPKLVQEKALEFFKKAELDAKDLPVWVGELYLELHRGTYTTHAKIKRGNRKSEFLLRDAEFFDAVSLFLAPDRREKAIDLERAVYDVTDLQVEHKGSHRAALDRAWKLVLLNQFHDIIPGSSIHWVYLDSARDYEKVRQLGESVRTSALSSIEPLINTSNYKKPVLIANTLNFSRREIVVLPGGDLRLVEVPAAGYTVVDIVEDNDVKEIKHIVKAEQTQNGITLENGLIRLRIDPQGGIASLRDLKAKRDVLSGASNVFQVYEDIPNAWDAWDIDIFYKEKGKSLGPADTIELVEVGPLRASVKVVRSFGNSRIEQHIVLQAESPRIDFRTYVDWQESRKLLRVEFHVAIRAMMATYEIQYGHVERPTHMNTDWDIARFEVCAQKWVDLSEPGYGVALLNDCKYGHDIHGDVMSLSLLRSPVAPDPLADRGQHQFVYSLLPHAGDFRGGRVVEEAYALNAPLLIKEVKPHAGTQPTCLSFFSVDRPGVIIEAVKVAEMDSSLVIRLYEAHGARGPVTLRTALPLRKAVLTDLLENQRKKISIKNGQIRLNLRPFEIVTIKLS